MDADFKLWSWKTISQLQWNDRQNNSQQLLSFQIKIAQNERKINRIKNEVPYNDIVIRRADRGNILFIMPEWNYIQKVEEFNEES
jgi:hypothetical protein